MTTLPTPGGDVGTWGEELNLWLETSQYVYNVELDPYNAVPDEVFTDGVTTASDATFTSATANFVAGDVGKVIVIQSGGPSQNQDHHTTIASRTSATEVELTNAPERTDTALRFYISRGGDMTSAIQAAIDDAGAAGGGVVLLPGVGYSTTGLTLKNRVTLMGAGRRATMLHLRPSSNQPVIKNHYTSEPNAQFCSVRDLWVDGARQRQSDITTTLSGAYTAGNTTISLTDASNFLPSGYILIGTNRLRYQGISGNTLQNVTGGVQGTTDAGAAGGATVTQHKASGIYFAMSPAVSQQEAPVDDFDPHFYVENVIIKNTKGCGIESWGQSENRWDKIYGHYNDQPSFSPSFDSWLSNCTSAHAGRMGFYVYYSNQMWTNCKAFYAGGNTASEGHGFLFEAPSQPATGCIHLSSCIAQDNKAHGFYLRNSDRVTLTSCGADSNGTSSAGTYVALKMLSANYNLIDLVCVERGTSPSNFQRNALEIDATSNYNQIRLTHGASAGGTVLEAIKSGSDLSGGNHIVINGQEGALTAPTVSNTGTVTATAATNLLSRTGHGLVADDIVTFTTTTTLPAPLSASTVYYVISSGLTADVFKVSTTKGGTEVDITDTGSGTHTMWEGYLPDPYKATTHRITLAQNNNGIALPLNAHLGARLEFIFKQDATGGRGVLFHSSYVTNGARVNDEPNSYTKIEFYYDGTSWLTTERISIAALSANATANSTTTGVKISGLDLTSVGAGRYAFEYLINYQAAATTTGVKFGVNHTGASSAVVVTSFWPGVGTTAITVSDTDQVANTFQLVGHLSARSMSTTSPNLGPTTAVDTANADNLVVIKGILTVTNTGTLELWHASEVAAASTVMAGSSVTLIKLT